MQRVTACETAEMLRCLGHPFRLCIAPDAGEAALLDEVDRILDKISAEGMGALTEEERRVLDEVSRSRRTN